jgi:hypothetical protein
LRSARLGRASTGGWQREEDEILRHDEVAAREDGRTTSAHRLS